MYGSEGRMRWRHRILTRLKAHIGVDKDSGLVHTLTTTAANVSDISQTPALLHGQESDVWADAGYVGVEKRQDMQEALAANDQAVQWHVAKRRKTVESLSEGWQKSLAQAYDCLLYTSDAAD